MPEIISDRVKEQTTSTGTGNITISGALVGFRAFSAVCSPGDTFTGTIVAVDAQGNPTGQWETGIYKYVSASTIERTTISLSSNNDQRVNFAAGTKHIFIDVIASKVVALQGSGLLKNPAGGGTNPDPGGSPTSQLRYVRDFVNGSTANSGAHWVEIRVLDANGQNVSVGKPVTASNTPSYGDLSLLTNGDLNTDDYINLSNGGEQWVQLDLGAVHTVSSVTVWHYYGDGRTYHGTKTMGSVDGASWFTIFNSAASGEYAESASGHTVNAPFNGTPTGTGGGGGPINTAQFHLGMHFHRYANNGGESGSPSPAPTYDYSVFRDWDCENLHCASVWLSNDTINEALIEQVYAAHAANGAKVLKTFGTVPTWASKRPGEANIRYPSYVGGLSGPANLTLYRSYVQRFVQRFNSYLWAVEGWNEPYPNTPFPNDGEWPQYTTMSITELADVQKALYLGAKAANPNILVFSPAQAYISCIPYLLDARTTQGEPLHQFFDVLSFHPYNRDANGSASGGYTLANEVAQVRQMLTSRGLSKPLADTEHGWLGGQKEGAAAWYSMTASQRATVLYETAQKAKEAGLITVCYYSHETELIGSPATTPTISTALNNIYTNLDTKWT